jgi:hypothetical protein
VRDPRPTKTSRSTIYRWAGGLPQHLDTRILGYVLAALTDLTERPVLVSDIMRFQVLPGMNRRDHDEAADGRDEFGALAGARIVGVSSGAATFSGVVGIHELILQLNDGRSVMVEPNILTAGDATPTLIVTIESAVGH